MSFAGHAAGQRNRVGASRTFSMQRLINWLFALFIFCGAISFIEPSPYDFVSLVVIPLWFVAGFRVHWMFVPIGALMCIYNIAGFISLVPYWNEADPVMFMLQSLYLLITTLFFALFFAERTLERTELCLKAFAASNVFAAGCAIAGYLDIAGSSAWFMNYDRATGSFKDPNVLGSFLIMGALYCMQLLMLGRTRWKLATGATLFVLLTGIFLTFSRGSWGAFVLAAGLMVSMTIMTTADNRLRRRFIIGALVVLALVAVFLIFLMSFETIREKVLDRTSGEGYDDRRWINQLRSLPTLIESPLGYGPLRFRLFFELEPHSSYVNAFASYGWLGGFAFFILVGATVFIGFRLCHLTSPYRIHAQVFFPALLGFLIQGFQIDIDHWRHVFLMLGAVWGLEAARQKWLTQKTREAGWMRSPASAA